MAVILVVGFQTLVEPAEEVIRGEEVPGIVLGIGGIGWRERRGICAFDGGHER